MSNMNKAAVDKHVSCILSRIKNEKERNLKGYQISKLYCEVKEYELARRYLSAFLCIKETFAPGHKLMGEIYEGLGQRDRAVAEYKRSLEQDDKQRDILLKICRIYSQMNVDPQIARYWLDRTERHYPGHEAVFKLKEQIFKSEGSSSTPEDLEDLLADELTKRPNDVKLRIKLLTLYMKSGRVNEAYEHAVKVESSGAYMGDISWYRFLVEVFEEYKNQSGTKVNGIFHQQYLGVLHNYVTLALEFCNCADTAEALFRFDQCLYSSKQLHSSGDSWELLMSQMQAQFFYHAGNLVMKRAQKSHTSWTEANGWSASCYFASYATEPPGGRYHGITNEQEKACVEKWRKLACYRASQTGHMLRILCSGDSKRWMQKVQEQFSLKEKKEILYELLFTLRSMKEKKQSSFLMKCAKVENLSMTFPTLKQLQEYDNVAHTLTAGDLHELVWIALQYYTMKEETQPNYNFQLFEDLPYSCKRLGTSAMESFCQLDAEAFLYAVIRCSVLQLEERQNISYRDADEPYLLPACLNDRLCQKDQAAWWDTASAMYKNTAKDNIAKKRAELQKGLEVIRCSGNHGLSVCLVIHLAKTFGERVREVRDDYEDETVFANKSSALQERALHYWKIAMEMLERLNKNLTLRVPAKRLFYSPEADPAGEDLVRLLGDGHYVMAEEAMQNGDSETALKLFSKSKKPEAAVHQAELYQQMADRVLQNQADSAKTDGETQELYTSLLSKCRDTLNESTDRLRVQKHTDKQRLREVIAAKLDEVDAKLADQRGESFTYNEADASDQEERDMVEENANVRKKTLPSFMTHSTPYGRSPRSSRSPMWNDYEQQENALSKAALDKIDSQMQALKLSMEEKYSESLKQNLEILSELKQTRIEVTQLKLKIEQIEHAQKEGAPIALAHLNAGTASPVNAAQQAFLRTHSPYHAADIDYSRQPQSYVFTQPPFHQYNYSVPSATQPDLRAPAQGKMNAGQNKSMSDQYSYEGDYDGEYDDQYEEEGLPPIPTIVDTQTTGRAQFHIPDSQLVQDWPYGNTVNLEGKSTLTYAPNSSPMHNARYLSGGPLRGQQPGVYQAAVAPPVGPSAIPGPGYFARPAAAAAAGMPVSYTAPEQGGLKFSIPASQSPVSRPFLVQQQTSSAPSLTSSMFNTMPPNAVLSKASDSPAVSLAQKSVVSVSSVTGGTLFKNNLPVTVAASGPAGINAVTSQSALFKGIQPPMPSVGIFGSTIPASVISPEKPSTSPMQGQSLTMTAQIPPVKPFGSIVAGTSVVSTPVTTTVAKSGKSPGTPSAARQDSSTHEGNEDSITEEHNDSYQGPEFEPIIPLPDEVEVKTGEEEESVMFKERGKLYRFVDNQWKERGVGEIKILKNEESKQVRIVMRRDQIHKVCANHYILFDMVISVKADSQGKVMTWTALDFSEDEQKMENFCCRFKTADIAQTFSDQFNAGVKIATEAKNRDAASLKDDNKKEGSSASAKVQGFGDKFKPKAGSWDCETCYVHNAAEVTQCVACNAAKPGAQPAKPTKSEFSGGVTFASTVTLPSGSGGFKFGGPLTSEPPKLMSAAAPAGAEKSTNNSSKGFNVIESTGFSFGQTPKTTTSVPSKTDQEAQPDAAVTSTTTSAPGTSGFLFGQSKPFSFGKDTSVTSSTSTDSAASKDAAKTVFGGFTFKTEPVIKNTEKPKEADSTISKSSEKTEPEKDSTKGKENPFASFSFSPPKSSSGGSFNFGGNSNAGSLSFASLSQSTTGKATFDKRSPSKSFEGAGKPLFTEQKSPAKDADVSKGAGEGGEDDDKVDEYEPNVDFKPVVPLPSIVEVKTGEEEEEALFCERVKLFRHDEDSKQWKERGIGNIKILKHSGGKRYRIVMRREQVLKLCANHAITREMKLLPLHSSDRAWCWYAQDYSEEEVKKEQFAVKFKNAEMAGRFRDVFEECHKDMIIVTSPVSSPTEEKFKTVTQKNNKDKQDVKPLSEMFKPKAGSWECQACYVRNNSDVTKCASCGTSKPGTSEPEQSDEVSSSSGSSSLGFGSSNGVTFDSSIKLPPKSEFKFGSSSSTISSTVGGGGFSFGTPSKSDSASGDGSTSSKGGFQFTFGSSAPSLDGDGNKSSGFTFKLSESSVKSPPKSATNAQEPSSPGDGYYVNHESEDSHIYFEPIVPLPDKIVVKTGEEEEDCLFNSKAKLYRFAKNEWKERGIGEMKILRHKDSKQTRVMMRREQILKVCCNHQITADLELKPMANTKGKAWVWHAEDFSESEGKHEQFAIRFRDAATAEEFKKVFDEVKGSVPENKSAEEDSKKEQQQQTPGKGDSSLDSFSFKVDQKELLKSPPAPPKFQFKSPVASPSTSSELDVEFLYEETPSAELVARAKQYQLPECFYLYEQKPPCPGCIGCNENVDVFNRDFSVTAAKSPTGTSELARLLTSPTSDTTETAAQPDVSTTPSMFGEAAKLGESSSFLNLAAKTSSSASQNLFSSSDSSLSFASLASSSEPTSFTKKDSGKPFAWAGAGQVLFGNKLDTSKDDDEGEHDDEGEVEQCADIHFEPIVELPKLVDVKTGEEEEEVIFSQRAKVYRFDKNQWKERGIGEVKILKNVEAGRFRILLRREQVLKVALNHLLTPDMELKPMATSETALCWFAVDYSDNEPSHGQFAVKFKTIPLRDEFKEIFENCQNILSEESVKQDRDDSVIPVQTLGATPDIVQATQAVSKTEKGEANSQKEADVVEGATVNVSQEYGEEDDDDEYEDEEIQIVFQKRATLQCQDMTTGVWKNLGMGDLLVTCDDDVAGGRIQMDNAQGVSLCNHIICMETRMTINEKQKCCEWTALDFATDEPERKTLKAFFSSSGAAKDFLKAFQDGLQMARESEISERNDQATFPKEITFPEIVGVSETGASASSHVRGLQGTCSPDLTAALQESLSCPQSKGQGDDKK